MTQLDLYGITQEQYDGLVARADGGCEGCGEAKRLGMDHDHATGHVRGLLCQACNLTLGRIERGLEPLTIPLALYLVMVDASPKIGKYRATPLHNFRIPRDVLAATKERAAREGRTVTDVVLSILRQAGDGVPLDQINP